MLMATAEVSHPDAMDADINPEVYIPGTNGSAGSNEWT